MKTRATITEILCQRRDNLREVMEKIPIKILMDNLEDNETREPKNSQNSAANDFKGSIKSDDDVAVICEFKPASPSKGHISSSKIEDALEVFNKAGASAVSILTEENYFNGSLKNVEEAKSFTDLPILRKDFIMDEYQIYEAKLAGANAVLLMNDVYPDIGQGISLCNELELDYIVECKNREEIEHSLDAGAEVVGINNRNFQNFSVDLKTTEKLSGMVPQEVVLVSESGVQGSEDAKRLASYGVDAILVGSAIMGSKNISDMLEAAETIVGSVKGLRVDRG